MKSLALIVHCSADQHSRPTWMLQGQLPSLSRSRLGLIQIFWTMSRPRSRAQDPHSTPFVLFPYHKTMLGIETLVQW